MDILFKDRTDAGRLLAGKLKQRFASGRSDVMVIAIARGGVPIAAEIAEELNVPFEVMIVGKLGHPLHDEYGIGGIVEDGQVWIDPNAVGLSQSTLEKLSFVIEKERQEIARKMRTYRNNRLLPRFEGKTLILVDDGLATGATMLMAARYSRYRGATDLIVVSPVCSNGAKELLHTEIDEIITLSRPDMFRSVGQFYQSYPIVNDEEVVRLLNSNHLAHQIEYETKIHANSMQTAG